MLNKLKARFILLAIISMAVTLIAAFSAVNITLRYRLSARTDDIIDLLHTNGGFPMFNFNDAQPDNDLFSFGKDLKREFHDETPYQTRYYIAYLDDSQTIINGDFGHIALANIDMILNQVSEINEANKSRGYIDNYRYGKFQTDDGLMIIGVDCKTDLTTLNTLLTITFVTIISCIIIVLLILLILSKRVLKPFEEIREKQRRFITDAGHELKTPIAIIQSNTEVMEMIDGENKWLGNIKQQTVRMNNLVKGLIELSKMDEQVLCEKDKQRIIISEIVYNSVESFKVLAESKGIEITSNIAPNIAVMGDLENIVRLVGILLDNAVSHCTPDGRIDLTLKEKKKTVVLTVINDGKPIPSEHIDRIFDRFYRVDSARGDDNHYGLGLSIAKAIVTSHKGKIEVRCYDGKVEFTAQLPLT